MRFMLVSQRVWEIMDVIYLAQDREQASSCELGNKLSDSEKWQGIYMTSCAIINVTRRFLFDVVNYTLTA
jgi:hypothetical protein